MITGLVACSGPEQAGQPVILTGFTMGTTYTVKLIDPVNDEKKQVILASIENILHEINAGMSTYLEDSELSRLNNSPGQTWINISPGLYRVIEIAMEVGRLSNGAFDPTIGPVVNLWGFGPVKRDGEIPDDDEIINAMQLVGLNKIELDNKKQAIRKADNGVYIDLSGIAKGYAVDRIAYKLSENFGLNNFLVEIGGEIRTYGKNPFGENWKIGIEKPETLERSVGEIITLGNNSLATSGDYRNFIEINGKHYSHTIDPATGKPVTHQLSSVSVIHPECVYADAWATTLLVAGPDRGLEMANKNGIAALFIVRQNDSFSELMSDRLSTFLLTGQDK